MSAGEKMSPKLGSTGVELGDGGVETSWLEVLGCDGSSGGGCGTTVVDLADTWLTDGDGVTRGAPTSKTVMFAAE